MIAHSTHQLQCQIVNLKPQIEFVNDQMQGPAGLIVLHSVAAEQTDTAFTLLVYCRWHEQHQAE